MRVNSFVFRLKHWYLISVCLVVIPCVFGLFVGNWLFLFPLVGFGLLNQVCMRFLLRFRNCEVGKIAEAYKE